MRIITIVGARPQFIKASAINRAFKNMYNDEVEQLILHTGQHYDTNMSQVFFDQLDIPRPDFNLAIGSLSHGQQTGRMLERIERFLILKRPRAVIVFGDTNTTLAGALAASKLHIPVVHIEAGLRSFRKTMPEEINRILTDHVSTLLFTPTEKGFRNLITEGFSSEHHPPYRVDTPLVYQSGDVMYDNALYFAQKAETASDINSQMDLEKEPFVLTTIHRAENTDDEGRLKEILKGIRNVANTGMKVILPLHPRTRKYMESLAGKDQDLHIQKHPGIKIIEPVSYLDMIILENKARMIITDSGGVQKEAYFFRKPSVILREETEWTEIVDNNAAIMAGANSAKISAAVERFSKLPPEDYPDIFGDGYASTKICKEIVENIQ